MFSTTVNTVINGIYLSDEIKITIGNNIYTNPGKREWYNEVKLQCEYHIFDASFIKEDFNSICFSNNRNERCEISDLILTSIHSKCLEFMVYSSVNAPNKILIFKE